MAEPDYYELLGIPRNADKKTIKDAYHRLAMKYHPDRNPAPEAEEKFKEIAKAYAVLSDQSKRAQYDAGGFEGVAHYSNEDLFRNVDLGSIFGDLGFGFGPGGDSIFDRFFRQSRRPAKGSDLQVRVQFPLSFIHSGGKKTIRIQRPVACDHCHGYGTSSGRPPEICPACGGTGHQVVKSSTREEQGSQIQYQQIKTCSVCGGRGHDVTHACSWCGGRGSLEKEEKLKINIPAGIEEGMSLRIAGHGLPGEKNAKPGDLFVAVYSEQDSRFQRRGADLWRAISLELPDAVLGTKALVPTLGSDVEVTIPSGIQADEIIRLRGKGLKHFHGEGFGDLNLRVHIQVPKRISAEERKLYEQLRDLQGK